MTLAANANTQKSGLQVEVPRRLCGSVFQRSQLQGGAGRTEKSGVFVRGGNGFLCYAFSSGRKPETSADVCGEQGCQQVTQAFPENPKPAEIHKQRLQKSGPAAASVRKL